MKIVSKKQLLALVALAGLSFSVVQAGQKTLTYTPDLNPAAFFCTGMGIGLALGNLNAGDLAVNKVALVYVIAGLVLSISEVSFYAYTRATPSAE